MVETSISTFFACCSVRWAWPMMRLTRCSITRMAMGAIRAGGLTDEKDEQFFTFHPVVAMALVRNQNEEENLLDKCELVSIYEDNGFQFERDDDCVVPDDIDVCEVPEVFDLCSKCYRPTTLVFGPDGKWVVKPE